MQTTLMEDKEAGIRVGIRLEDGHGIVSVGSPQYVETTLNWWGLPMGVNGEGKNWRFANSESLFNRVNYFGVTLSKATKKALEYYHTQLKKARDSKREEKYEEERTRKVVADVKCAFHEEFGGLEGALD